jgi:hypothetical protein
MSFLKKRAVPFLAAALSLSLCTAVPSNADSDPKPRSIKAVRASKTVAQGSEFELKVRTSPRDANEDDLRWTIVSGKNVVRFDDSDRTDDEIELKALRPGKAKLRCQIRGTNKKVFITVTVKSRKTIPSISRIGAETRTVRAGKDFELKVRKPKNFDDDHLKWSIADPSIVRFDDDDRSDDEMEFTARKAGTTTIRCKNLLSGRSISYTVKVEPRQAASMRPNWDEDDDLYEEEEWDDWD